MERNYVTVTLCIKPMPYKIIQTIPVAWWRNSAASDLRVRFPSTARLRNDSGQVVHTHVPRRRVFATLGVVFSVIVQYRVQNYLRRNI